MTKNEANKVASAVIDIILTGAPEAGALDFVEGPRLIRCALSLLALPYVAEWVGYHIEVLEDEGRVMEVAIIKSVVAGAS